MLKPSSAVLLFAGVCGVGAAHGAMPGMKEDNPVVASRWNVDLGGYVVDLDTNAAVGIGGIVGTLLNLEEILGLDTDQTIVRLDGFYRFRPKHTLAFEFLSIDRSSVLVLNEDFVYRDVSFTASGRVDATFNMDMFKLVYEYSFINDGKVNAGVSAGVSFFRFEGFISGQGFIIDELGNQFDFGTHSAREEIFAPVPAFGIFVDYAIKRWLILHVSAEFFDLNVTDLDLRFQDSRATLDFWFTRHVGFGFGLNGTDLRVRDTGDGPFRIDYRFEGVVFYVGVAF